MNASWKWLVDEREFREEWSDRFELTGNSTVTHITTLYKRREQKKHLRKLNQLNLQGDVLQQ